MYVEACARHVPVGSHLDGDRGHALRLTVSYLKYIFVDGRFIDVDADRFRGNAIDNIFPVPRKEASFPVASSMKKPASQSPVLSTACYGLQLTYGLLHASLHLVECV